MTARAFFRRFAGDRRGTAALELAGVGALLAVGAMNAAEVGRYAYQCSEVSAAAQAAAEAALVTCDLDHLPATANCSGLATAMLRAAQSTQLGSNVTLSGYTEGYFCMTTSGGLVQVSGAASKPADCSAATNAAAGATPTLYMNVTAAYGFQSLFPGVTLANSFASTINRTAWMRMA